MENEPPKNGKQPLKKRKTTSTKMEERKTTSNKKLFSIHLKFRQTFPGNLGKPFLGLAQLSKILLLFIYLV
jgi:hypothetical protein